MTVLPWEDEPVPPPPGVSDLARIIAQLAQGAWASGERQTHRLQRGLTLTVFLLDDELHIALTRDGSEPDLAEAEIVAREAGWPHFTHGWRTGSSGTRGLVLTRAEAPRPAAPPPATAPAAPGPAPNLEDACRRIRAAVKAQPRNKDKDQRVPFLDQARWDEARGRPLPRAEILQLLLSPRDHSMPDDLWTQARGARTAHLNGMSVHELLDELDWFWRHWGRWRVEGFQALSERMSGTSAPTATFATPITVP